MAVNKEYNFKPWNSDSDVLITNAPTLLTKNHPVVAEYSSWAYSINTSTGLYYMQTETSRKEEVIKSSNGKSVTFTYPVSITSLYFANDQTAQKIYEDVTVWAHKYYRDFMIVTLHETDQTILIDSRGEPFELPIDNIPRYHSCTINQDKREGYYLLERTIVLRYKTREEQSAFEENTTANFEAIFNKEFNRFVRANANNTNKYLYLTAGSSKCGALIKHFIKNGMSYEIVPNVLVDDETLNIRIPLEGENATRKDVQFLCAKYYNTYSIYDIPYTEIGEKLELTRIQKCKHEKLGIYFSSTSSAGHETIAYFIINTFRKIFQTSDDYEIYKKVFSKIIRLIARGHGKLEHNYFLDLLLLHPADQKLDASYLVTKKDYISMLLSTSNFTTLDELGAAKDSDLPFDITDFKISPTYRLAFDCSKKRFKEEMSIFESDAVYKIYESGGTVSKWKSEATLFALVKKTFPDAVYQYYADWLGLQSLDIFIPSLQIAIEYQGEQHYHPVEIFGGESAYKKLIIRDARKAELCKSHNIKLIYWKYDEVINSTRLATKINATRF